MLERGHALPITHQARMLGISLGSVYYLPRPVNKAEPALVRLIDELHLEFPFIRARILRRHLQREVIEQAVPR